jgi:hypothetical protein
VIVPPLVALVHTGTVLAAGEAGYVAPLTLPTVVASVPLVVTSPLKSPFVIEVDPENFVRLPDVGDPVVVTVPPDQVADMVMPCALGVIDTPVPAVKLANAKLCPEVPPIRSCPSVTPLVSSPVPPRDCPSCPVHPRVNDTACKAAVAGVPPSVNVTLVSFVLVIADGITPMKVEMLLGVQDLF